MHAGWATRTLNRLQMMSPTSLRISFTLLRRGASAGLDECIRTEWRLAHRTWADLNEGVRAFEKDKDGASLARTSQRGRQRQREEGVRLRQETGSTRHGCCVVFLCALCVCTRTHAHTHIQVSRSGAPRRRPRKCRRCFSRSTRPSYALSTSPKTTCRARRENASSDQSWHCLRLQQTHRRPPAIQHTPILTRAHSHPYPRPPTMSKTKF